MSGLFKIRVELSQAVPLVTNATTYPNSSVAASRRHGLLKVLLARLRRDTRLR